MNVALESDPLTPTQRRTSRRLGLILGALCLALVAAFFIIFTFNGLPKDPKAWKRLQQREAAASTPTAAPVQDHEEKAR